MKAVNGAEINTGDSNLNQDEARKRRRYEFNNNILCFKCTHPTYQSKIRIPFIFNILDISYGGIGMVCPQKMEQGTEMAFNLNFNYQVRELKVVVKWCSFTDGEYRVGTQFIELTYDDVMFINDIVQNVR